MSKQLGFSISDGVLQVEELEVTLKAASTILENSKDDELLTTLVRLAHGFAYTVERIRLEKGFKPVLPASNAKKKKPT